MGRRSYSFACDEYQKNKMVHPRRSMCWAVVEVWRFACLGLHVTRELWNSPPCFCAGTARYAIGGGECHPQMGSASEDVVAGFLSELLHDGNAGGEVFVDTWVAHPVNDKMRTGTAFSLSPTAPSWNTFHGNGPRR